MGLCKVPLADGIKVGDRIYKNITLGELTGGDVIDAQLEAERLEMVPQMDAGGNVTGYRPEFVKSPMMVGLQVLRRQISIDDLLPAPIEMEMLRKFTPRDLDLLTTIANAMDGASTAAPEAVALRGRPDGVSPTAADAG